MKEFNTKPPSGTKDSFPDEVKFRERILNMIRKVFENFGFSPIETPAIERIETLMGKYGEEGEKLIFKILKRGKQAASGEVDLALRYDLTIPLMRFYAAYQNKLPRIFRRYQIGPVWRADRPGKGRFREFYQCDVDIIGSYSPLADTEIILTIAEALSQLNISEYTIRLNSIKILTGLLEIYNIPKTLKQNTLIALDKIDKININGVEKELKSLGLSKKTINQLVSDLSKPASQLRKRIETSAIGREGLAEIDSVFMLTAPILKRGTIKFSPFLVRGLEYYTGPIYEIYVKETGSAIASGGRYDNLIGMFTKKQVPACGCSLGIDRILSFLSNTKEKNLSRIQVFITVWNETFRNEALQLASELRNNDITTEIYLGEGKIGGQLRFASDRNAMYCVIYGPDEKIKKEVILKNLATGEQKNVRREEFASTLTTLIKKR